MRNDYTNPAFKKLLQKLQEESWQLELLISGFAIFGLISAIGAIDQMGFESFQRGDGIVPLLLAPLAASCYILAFNLILHVVFRGLWIGAIGLRYVSGDIDYEQLNYSPLFTKHLKNKVGSFDRYIARLEIYCSLIFSVSFLLVFYFIAFFIIFTILALVTKYAFFEDLGSVAKWIGVPVLFFLILGAFLTFIDFITLGWLKRKKWTSKVYYPFYRVFYFITLSFFYRPLVHNFLDTKLGKRISYFLFPFYVLFSVLVGIDYQNSNYFASNDQAETIGSIGLEANYADLYNIENQEEIVVQIPSKIIEDKYLSVFIPFSPEMEDNVFDHNEGLKPENDRRGYFSHNFIIDRAEGAATDSLRSAYLKVVNKIYILEIEGKKQKTDFIYTANTLGSYGFETLVDLSEWEKGRRLLTVKEKTIREEKAKENIISQIPFWYYPD